MRGIIKENWNLNHLANIPNRDATHAGHRGSDPGLLESKLFGCMPAPASKTSSEWQMTADCRVRTKRGDNTVFLASCGVSDDKQKVFMVTLQRCLWNVTWAVYHLTTKTGIFGWKFKWFRPFHWNVSGKYGNAQMYSSFPIPTEMTGKFRTICQNHARPGRPGTFSRAFQL